MDAQVGDKVYLMLGNECVCIVLVSRDDPSLYCSGRTIGQGNVVVLIEKCLKEVKLPFPTMYIDNLKCAIGISLCLPKILLRPFNGLASNTKDSNQREDNQTNQVEPPTIDVMLVTSLDIDICIRELWKNKRVVLWDEGMLMIANEGLTLYVFPYELVNFEQLDEECVGVAIERTHANVLSENTPYVGSINLVK